MRLAQAAIPASRCQKDAAKELFRRVFELQSNIYLVFIRQISPNFARANFN